MNPLRTKCLSPGELAQLLDPQRSERIEGDAASHLNECRHCQQGLEALAADPQSWQDAAAALQQKAATIPLALRDTLDRLDPSQNLFQFTARPSRPVRSAPIAEPDNRRALIIVWSLAAVLAIAFVGYLWVLGQRDRALEVTESQIAAPPPKPEFRDDVPIKKHRPPKSPHDGPPRPNNAGPLK